MLYHQIVGNKPKFNSEELNDLIINLCSQTFIIPAKAQYSMFITTPDYIARPDLVSQYLYNTTQYTDIICKLNGISNPFELNDGQILICPDGADIDKFYLKSEEDYVDDINNTPDNSKLPQQKQVSDKKRSANDSVVGDKRFEIDKENRIIIY